MVPPRRPGGETNENTFMGDITDEPSSTMTTPSAPQHRRNLSRPRPASGTTFVVERLGRAASKGAEPAPASPGGEQTSDPPSGDTRSLTEPEQRARLSALAEAQLRGPDERRLAEERSWREAIQELKGQSARLDKQLAVTLAEQEAERLRSTEVARDSEALRQRLAALERDNDRLSALLRHAEEAARERNDALLAERARSEKLSSDLNAARNRAADDKAETEELRRKLAEAERELASYRSQPWWRRLIG